MHAPRFGTQSNLRPVFYFRVYTAGIWPLSAVGEKGIVCLDPAVVSAQQQIDN